MTRMEGLRIRYEQKVRVGRVSRTEGEGEGQTAVGKPRKRDSQKRSFDFYGQLAIAARLRR